MPKNYTLRTKFTLTIALTAILTVVLTSVLSNFVINRQFVKYIGRQQQAKASELASSLSLQYSGVLDSWDMDSIHTIGMYALYDGYIVNVFNNAGQSIWDAQNHDMSTCHQVMNDIKARMERKYPSVNGEFASEQHPLMQGGAQVGSVEISYFGPFFLSENDFNFLDTLNLVLLGIAVVALHIAALVGSYTAERLSRPLRKTVSVSGQMAAGDYRVRIEEQTNTLELNQLIVSINHLASTLDKQEKLRKQLTADIAHDLRTPLHTVGMQIESMIDGIWEPTPQRLQSCYDEINRIATLVADMERLAKVEAGNLNLQLAQTDYAKLIDNCLESLEIAISKKHIAVEKQVAETSVICVDPTRWRQVVHNLLTNAIKYTPDGGKITVSVGRGQGGSVLSVADNGVGISQEELPFVFERFYRADKSRNHATGGAGIGLAIVKSVVEAHGGRVEVESRPGAGSVFRVFLPDTAAQG